MLREKSVQIKPYAHLPVFHQHLKNKKMKKVILMMLVAFSSTMMQAQDNTAATVKSREAKMTPEQNAQKAVDKLNAIVGLSADQQQKIRTLALDRIAKAKAVRAKYKGSEDKEAAKQEMKTLRQEFKQQVKALLTPEQMAKLKAHHKANRPNKGEGKSKEGMKAAPAGSEDDAIPDVE
jgi:Spy/CpxP family protein refolding chaperone